MSRMTGWTRGMAGLALLALTAAACGGGSQASGGQGREKLRIGHEAPLAVTYLPMVLTVEGMTAEGYDVELVPFETPDAMTQALAGGSIDVASASTGTAMAGIDAGLEAQVFMGLGLNIYPMVARTSIEGCAGFEGQRVGIHSYEGTTGSLTTKFFEEQCPSVQPNIKVVPGSENRLAAMLANQLDATAMDIPTAQQLLLEHPEQFHIIDEFGEVQIAASSFFATEQYLNSASETLSAFVSTYAQVLEEGRSDPSELIAKGTERIPELNPQVLENTVNTFIEDDLWQPAKALEDDLMTTTIEVFGNAEPYENISGPDDVVNRTYVEKL